MGKHWKVMKSFTSHPLLFLNQLTCLNALSIVKVSGMCHCLTCSSLFWSRLTVRLHSKLKIWAPSGIQLSRRDQTLKTSSWEALPSLTIHSTQDTEAIFSQRYQQRATGVAARMDLTVIGFLWLGRVKFTFKLDAGYWRWLPAVWTWCKFWIERSGFQHVEESVVGLLCHRYSLWKCFPVPLSGFTPFRPHSGRCEVRPGLEALEAGKQYSYRLSLHWQRIFTSCWSQVTRKTLLLLSHLSDSGHLQLQDAIAFAYGHIHSIAGKGGKETKEGNISGVLGDTEGTRKENCH